MDRLQAQRDLRGDGLNARGDRGRGASFIGLDEYAHHFDSLDRLGQATAAEALFAAVVPAASQYKELKTVIIGSTPSGDSNKFAKLRDIALEHPSRQSVYFHGATWEINPRIDEEDLGQERLTLGEELFRQEFQADFLSGGGYFLTNDAIERCVEERGDMSDQHGREYVVGIDPALSSDVFGCVVLGVDRFQGKLSVAQVHGWGGAALGELGGRQDSRGCADGAHRRGLPCVPLPSGRH